MKIKDTRKGNESKDIQLHCEGSLPVRIRVVDNLQRERHDAMLQVFFYQHMLMKNSKRTMAVQNS